MTLNDLWALLTPMSGRQGFHAFHFDSQPALHVPTKDPRRFARAAGRTTFTTRRVSVCPRIDQDPYPVVAGVACLWARVESGPGSAALLGFSREPTVILRDGGTVRRTALWALSGVLSHEQAQYACRRLAEAFGGRKEKDTDPSTFTFELPGQKVDVERWTGQVYDSANAVAGGMDDPRPKPDWRELKGRAVKRDWATERRAA